MKRLSISLLLASSWVLGLAGLSFYTPALVNVQASFNTTESLVKLSISFFILAKSISMFASIPFADSFKRRTLLLFGLALFTAGAIICAIAKDIHLFLAGRFLGGLGVSLCILMGRSIVNDLFPPKAAVQVFSLVFIINALAISVLPFLSSLITASLGWRVIFIILSVYGLLVIALCYFYLPRYSLVGQKQKMWDLQKLWSLWHILRNTRFLKLALLLSFMDAGEKVLSTNLPFLLIKHFGYSVILAGTLQTWLWCAHLIGLFLCTILILSFRIESITKIGGICTGLSVILLLLTPHMGDSVLGFFAAGALFYMLATGFILASCLVRIVEPFPQQIGLATALAMSIEFLLGFILTALSGYLPGTELSVLLNLLILTGVGVVLLSLLS